jgi:hypothetical protein
MIFSLFTLFGIGLCISRHWGWGLFCFLIAFFALLAML